MLFLLVVLLTVCVGNQEVTLPDGSVLGGTADGAFLGIPYGFAKRFQYPVPSPPLGRFNASSFGDACPQQLSPMVQCPQLEHQCVSSRHLKELCFGATGDDVVLRRSSDARRVC